MVIKIKTITFVSLSIYIFFSSYIILILLLTRDKVQELRIVYIYSIYIKVWCKGSDIMRGDVWAPAHLL